MRKNVFSRLAPAASQPVPSPEPAPSPIPAPDAPAPSASEAAKSAQRVSAVGVLGQMLHDIQHEARDSERVVALDPALVDPSPVRDRIDDAASDAQARLNASVAEHGQRVPILVRRRPGDASRYVVVFGHRRLIAARANQVPVRAIVVDMAVDDALVAQGQENNERRNTSFIERCLFARRLRDAGLSNLQIAAALAIHPSLSSQMIGVAEALPEALVLAIGPAAEIGRPRWQALAALVKETGEGRWKRVMAQPGFAAAPSAERFRTAFAALSQAEAASAASARKLADAEGAYATIKRTGRSLTCVIPTGAQRPDGIAFADWLEDKLPSLRAEFLNGE